MTALASCDLTTLLTLADEVRVDAENSKWTTTHELLAQIWDLLHIMRVERLSLAPGFKRWNLPKDRRIPRPGEPEEATPTVSPRQLAIMMMGN